MLRLEKQLVQRQDTLYASLKIVFLSFSTKSLEIKSHMVPKNEPYPVWERKKKLM